jgi:hypothetical protein
MLFVWLSARTAPRGLVVRPFGRRSTLSASLASSCCLIIRLISSELMGN